MTNEEKKAKLAAVTSIEDAYALAKECGFTGTMEDFKAMCAKAAGNGEQMDLDAMDSVAGGFGILEELHKWDWLFESNAEKMMQLLNNENTVPFEISESWEKS